MPSAQFRAQFEPEQYLFDLKDRLEAQPENELGRIAVATLASDPTLAGIDLSGVLLEFAPCTGLTPHVHRVDEFFTAISGKLLVEFVDELGAP